MNEKLDDLLKLRLSSEEKLRWEQIAKERGLTVSALVRETMKSYSAPSSPADEHYLSFPDPMWEQLQTVAASSNCSANDLIVNTLGAAMTSGVSVSWTNTVSYAPITGSSFQMFNLSNTEEET